MKRTASIGSRVPPAVTSTRSPSRSPPGLAASAASTAASSSGGSGSRPIPHSPGDPSAPVPGLEHDRAALAQRGEVGLRRGVLVHRVVHRRREHERPPARERRRAEQVVGLAGCELGHRVGGRGRDR